MRILVTDGENRKALAIVRALGKKYSVFSCSKESFPMVKYSKYIEENFKSPKNSNDFVNWVLNKCREKDIKAIICPQEVSIKLLAQKYKEFEKEDILLTFPSQEILNKAFDKKETIFLAKKIGVPIPETYFPESFEGILYYAKKIGFPVVLKDRFSYYYEDSVFKSGNGTTYCPDESILKKHIKGIKKRESLPMVQSFVKGYGAGAFFLINKQGDIVAEFAHQRIRDIKPTGSASVLRKSVPMKTTIREYSKKLLDEANWWGIAMVEYKIQDRVPVLMEINGRFWGSLQLSLEAGVNFPDLLIKVAQNKKVERKLNYEPEVYSRWWLGDLIRSIRVLKGPPKNFPGDFPSRKSAIIDFLGSQPPNTYNEVYKPYDPLPAMGEGLYYFKKAIKLLER